MKAKATVRRPARDRRSRQRPEGFEKLSRFIDSVDPLTGRPATAEQCAGNLLDLIVSAPMEAFQALGLDRRGSRYRVFAASCKAEVLEAGLSAEVARASVENALAQALRARITKA